MESLHVLHLSRNGNLLTYSFRFKSEISRLRKLSNLIWFHKSLPDETRLRQKTRSRLTPCCHTFRFRGLILTNDKPRIGVILLTYRQTAITTDLASVSNHAEISSLPITNSNSKNVWDGCYSYQSALLGLRTGPHCS